MDKICGIYKIISPTNKIYIGQSINIYKRWMSYKNMKRNSQFKLYSSFLKHGVENHKFEIIQHCEQEQLNKLEKYYVDLFKTFNSEHGLNLKDGGGSKGATSEETKHKKSEASKGEKGYWFGKTHSKETRKKISDFQKGRKKSEEHNRKNSQAQKGKKGNMFGKHHSEETKRKLGLASKGRKHSEETKRKQSNWHKGKIFSEETKLKMSEAAKNRTEEHNRKISKTLSGKKISSETISKREATKRRIRQERLTMIF